MKVALYCRVSTEEQKNRESIKNQIFDLERYCKLHNHKIIDYYIDDGLSGAIPTRERPECKKLLEDVYKNKFEAIVIFKLDRLTRDIYDAFEIRKILFEKNISLITTTENIDDVISFSVRAAYSEDERKKISDRSRAGVDRALRDGKWPGGPIPYGYKKNDNGKLSPSYDKIPNCNYSEAEIIKLIFDLSANNKLSSPKIADFLNKENIPLHARIRKFKNIKKIGIYWYAERVRCILRDPKYKGIFFFGKRTKYPERKNIKINISPLVDEITWQNANNTLKENLIKATRNCKRNYLLRGKIKCSRCGRTYSGCSDHGIRKYMCPNDRWKNRNYPFKCNNPRIHGDQIEYVVIKDIEAILNNPDIIRKTIDKELKNFLKVEELKIKEEDIKNQIKKLNKQKKKALELHIENIIDKDELKVLLKEIKIKSEIYIKELKKVIQLIENCSKKEELSQKANYILGKIVKDLKNTETSKIIKNAIDILIDKIEIKKENEKVIATITYNFKNESVITPLNHRGFVCPRQLSEIRPEFINHRRKL